MPSHNEFILTPVTSILSEVISASSGMGSGIETFPLYDYIMQSVFIKMTGFQEQKMKCITWELATINFDYRRTLLGNADKLGECSSYSDKNKIYKRLVENILKYDQRFDLKEIDKKSFIDDTVHYLKKEFKGSNLSIWAQSNFNEFSKTIKSLIKPQHLLEIDNNANTNLFVNVLQDKYEVLYSHRNRIAHNTQSYQQNLPTLKTLMSKDYQYENYFIFFTLLILIDKIFIDLYQTYLLVIESNI